MGRYAPASLFVIKFRALQIFLSLNPCGLSYQLFDQFNLSNVAERRKKRKKLKAQSEASRQNILFFYF